MADSVTAGWLSELGLSSCVERFREEGIDCEALMFLEDAQLEMLGVRRMGDRTKLKAKASLVISNGGDDPKVLLALGRSRSLQNNRGISPSSAHERAEDRNGEAALPEHLQVLTRLSTSTSMPARQPATATSVATKKTSTSPLADKVLDRMAATSFVLQGGPVEKYRQGGKGKAHKKFIKILPDRKMAYDAKAVGPIVGVRKGGAEHHTDDPEVIMRSFTVVLEGNTDVHLIAPSFADRKQWVAGISHIMAGDVQKSTKKTMQGSEEKTAQRKACEAVSSKRSVSETHLVVSRGASERAALPAQPFDSSSTGDVQSAPIKGYTSSSATTESPPIKGYTEAEISKELAGEYRHAARPVLARETKSQTSAITRETRLPAGGEEASHSKASVISARASTKCRDSRLNQVGEGPSSKASVTSPRRDPRAGQRCDVASSLEDRSAESSRAPAFGRTTSATAPVPHSRSNAPAGVESEDVSSAPMRYKPGSFSEKNNSKGSETNISVPHDIAAATSDRHFTRSSESEASIPAVISSGSQKQKPPARACDPVVSSTTAISSASSSGSYSDKHPVSAGEAKESSAAYGAVSAGSSFSEKPAAAQCEWRVVDTALRAQGGSVLKGGDPEHFAVAMLSKPLQEGKGVHEWELEFAGALHWCGVGVAEGGVRTTGSLRRADMRGRAWFWHSKGFLCDGDRFVEWENVPPFGPRDRITVQLDSDAGEVRFLRGLKREAVPGVIRGVRGQVYPAIYTDGTHVTCSMIVPPHSI